MFCYKHVSLTTKKLFLRWTIFPRKIWKKIFFNFFINSISFSYKPQLSFFHNVRCTFCGRAAVVQIQETLLYKNGILENSCKKDDPRMCLNLGCSFCKKLLIQRNVPIFLWNSKKNILWNMQYFSLKNCFVVQGVFP